MGLGVRAGVAVVVRPAGREEAQRRSRYLADRLDRRRGRRCGSRPRGRRGRPRPARVSTSGRLAAPRGSGPGPAGRRPTGSRAIASVGPEALRAARRPGSRGPRRRRKASSTLVGVAGGDQGTGDRRAAQRVVVVGGEGVDLGVDGQAEVAQTVDRASEAHAGADRAGRRGPPRTPRPSGSIPKPRMWSSPSHRPRSRVTRALISTPGMSVRPAGTASPATTSR